MTEAERQEAAAAIQALGQTCRSLGFVLTHLGRALKHLLAGPVVRSVLDAFAQSADETDAGPEVSLSCQALRQMIGDDPIKATVHFDAEGGYHSDPGPIGSP